MKNNESTLIDINSSAFWIQVKEEHDIGHCLETEKIFICDTSRLFNRAYKIPHIRDEIMRNAALFLAGSEYWDDFYIWVGPLLLFLDKRPNLQIERKLKVRSEFINWMIQKTQAAGSCSG